MNDKSENVTHSTIDGSALDVVVCAILDALDELQLERESYAGTPRGRELSEQVDHMIDGLNALTVDGGDHDGELLGDLVWDIYERNRPASGPLRLEIFKSKGTKKEVGQ